MAQEAMRYRFLTSGDAAKLRGLVQWVDSELLGRPCRGALSALVARQYYEQGAYVHDGLFASLQYLVATMTTCASRSYLVGRRAEPPVVVYSDASTDARCQSGLRLGAVVLDGHRSWCLSVDVPESVVQSWKSRETYISVAELLIAPILTLECSELFTGRDIIWFIDNQSALGALVKAASSAFDMSELALLCSFSLAVMDARAWFEYVPSKLNLSDGLSRAGWSAADPSWRPLVISIRWEAFQDRVSHAFQLVAALGESS